MKLFSALKKQVNADWVAQGDQLANDEQFTEAIGCYEKALTQNPTNVLAWKGKTLALIHLNKYDEAQACIDQAVIINPKNVTLLWIKVQVLSCRGEQHEEIKCYDQIILLQPHNRWAWRERMTACKNLKKYDEAMICADQYLKIDPADIKVLLDKACILILLRKYKVAIQCYEDILKIDSTNVEATSNKGRILVLTGKTDEALKWYDDKLATHPSMTVLQMRKGMAFAMQGQHDRALQCYDELIRINKTDYTTLVYQGVSYFCSHQFQMSTQCVRVAPKSKEASAIGLVVKGVYHFSLGENEKWGHLLSDDIVSLIKPDDWLGLIEYWFYKGLLFSAIKAYPEATAAFEKLLSLEPDHVIAKTELAAIQKLTPLEVVPQLSHHSPSVPECAPEELKSHESNFIHHNQLKIKERLAVGGHGEVFSATWNPTKLKSITVAVKQLKADIMDEKIWKEFLREVNIQSKLDSNSVVALYGITGVAPFYMVMEFMGRGSLHDVLVAAKVPQNLSWDDRLSMALNLSIGLAYLHSRKPPVIHRDIKSHNILVNEEGVAKFGDFGLSSARSDTHTQSLTTSATRESTSIRGTLRWLAPELLNPDLLPEELSALKGKHTPSTDVHSFATVLREMASHNIPYSDLGDNEDLVVHYITTGKIEKFNEATTPNTPREYSDLVYRCWDMNPLLRPTGEVIVKALRPLAECYNAASTLFKSKKPHAAVVKKSAPTTPAPQPPKKSVAMNYMTNTRRGTVSAPVGVISNEAENNHKFK